MAALRNSFMIGAPIEHDLRRLYYEDDAKLLLSHCRRAAGGALLAEAETLARDLVATTTREWDLTHRVKLLKVLAAQADLGWAGKAAAVEEYRASLCDACVAQMNRADNPSHGHHHLFGRMDDVLRAGKLCG